MHQTRMDPTILRRLRNVVDNAEMTEWEAPAKSRDAAKTEGYWPSIYWTGAATSQTSDSSMARILRESEEQGTGVSDHTHHHPRRPGPGLFRILPLDHGYADIAAPFARPDSAVS
ncbi:hypothetical protein MAPG_03933 [Magnaporthiopsis poae ATCC 64411]|uniref:Uncharacterized protein n=1 Tax=Magnaporthiopsis poae (strain ATCC 64411 / 73-15) TaxID=644358 RepID=A0A0C4DVD1_MAGP6|nr:hypothetical protein MAPG_03933 [Magnaporthiopsis poae ATCC 64411]